MKIYLMGAHSTGKTTLCRHISTTYNIPMITETARQVLSEMEVSLEALRTDISLVNGFQSEILKRQMEMEKSRGENFVSDRAFDTLAYIAEHGTFLSEVLFTRELREYAATVREGLVFFIRPHKELLAEDGVRETPTWESVLKIDGMVKFLLEAFAVPYLSISCLSMQERISMVDFALNGRLEGERNGS